MTQLIFIALFPLIALIAMGYALKRIHVLDEPFWKGAEKLNYYILFPSMLFLNLATAHIEAKSIAQIMFVVGIVVTLASSLLYALRHYFKTPAARLWGVYAKHGALQYLYWFSISRSFVSSTGHGTVCNYSGILHSIGQCAIGTCFE